jgi:hypothetical protein
MSREQCLPPQAGGVAGRECRRPPTYGRWVAGEREEVAK